MWLPKICRIRSSQLSANQYFVLSLVCGFLISFYWPDKYIQENDCSLTGDSSSIKDEYSQLNEDFEPQLNLAQKPMIAKKQVKSLVRPRYFSTELNVRLDRLFLGVLTVQENIDSLATAVNKTTAHLVNKIKFFIHANNVQTNFKLKNIVGFTDTRENYRPFHVLKYIADNYVEDYDFFFLIEDSAYLNAKALMEQLLNHISMSFDVYMGMKIEDSDEGFCDLKAGIILSSSVIKKVQRKLDACVRGAEGNQHSINIGKCIQLATDIGECQESFQGVTFSSYQLSNQRIYRDLHQLKDDSMFNNATSVYPVTTPDDMYILHAYFSRLNLEAVKLKIKNFELEAQTIGNGTISNSVLEVKWPLGVPNSVKPQTRQDMIIWVNLNLTHSFMGEEGVNVKPLNKVDAQDIQKILDGILAETAKKYPELSFAGLQTAYRKFDPVRGMDYR